jgi:hypothetical protein
MEELKKIQTFSLLSLVLAGLVAATSLFGIFFKSIYSLETENYAAQAMGQDVVNLVVVVPALILSSILVYRGIKPALFIWVGILFYLLYTFVIFCFGVHFNSLFLVYCITFGLTTYILIGVLWRLDYPRIRDWFDKKTPKKLLGIYMCVVASLFYLLWLRDIIPSLITGDVPTSITDAGLPTSPVYVLDLSIYLPGIIICAIMLLKDKSPGYFLAPSLLAFVIVMDIAIGGMMISLYVRDFENDLSIVVVFSILSIISIIVLVLFLRHLSVRSRVETNKQPNL